MSYKELLPQQNQYDRVALNQLMLNGYHLPTVIVDDAEVIAISQKEKLGLNEAKTLLQSLLADKSYKVASIIFERESQDGVLIRISHHKRIGNYETVVIK